MAQGGGTSWLAADLGGAPYRQVWELQSALAAARHKGRLDRNAVLFLEHEPVFTLGRRGGLDNLRVTGAFLEQAGVPVVHVERGGDVTYHGPGQIVVYPIVDLPGAHLKVVTFVEMLEEVMVRTAADWGVPAGRDPRNRGVWVNGRKLGSVGIAVRRGVSFHGLALNVNPDLMPFQWIHPCGLEGVSMTSLAREGAKGATVDRTLPLMRRRVEEVFGVTLEETSLATLERAAGIDRSDALASEERRGIERLAP
jgi:lipoate-protein ligase B